MIGSSAYICIIIMIAGGILLPAGICIWWFVTRKERLTTALVGAGVWLVFAMILERIPIAFLLNPSTSLGKTISESVILYTITGALLAGIFEETGRLIAFKTILKKRTNRETAISYGIGHGGFEAIFLLGMTGISNLVYSAMISSGTYQTLIDQAAAGGADVSALEALPEQLASLTPLMGCLSVSERAFAILGHIAFSIVVFYAVRNSRISIYLLAIALHALYDVPAALYQKGVINMYVCEVILAVFAVIVFAIVYVGFYKKLKLVDLTQPVASAPVM